MFFENAKVPLMYRLAANSTQPIAFSPSSACGFPGLNGQPVLVLSGVLRNL